jgi:hypothetical protein
MCLGNWLIYLLTEPQLVLYFHLFGIPQRLPVFLGKPLYLNRPAFSLLIFYNEFSACKHLNLTWYIYKCQDFLSKYFNLCYMIIQKTYINLQLYTWLVISDTKSYQSVYLWKISWHKARALEKKVYF